MKWISRSEKFRKQDQWHRWFAWKPVQVDGFEIGGIRVPDHRVWLEYVDRRLYGGVSWPRYYKYRPLSEETQQRGVSVPSL